MRAADLTQPSRLAAALAAGTVSVLVAACGSSGATARQASPGVTVTVTKSAAASAAAATRAAATPRLVAVTTKGALVLLSPATGAVTRTLVPSGVVGDEISVGSGAVYFARRNGCTDDIESLPLTGGTPVVITAGTLPALSPDGSKLAFASEPSLTGGCIPSNSDLTPLFKLVVRTLSTGAETAYPMVPAGQDNGLPAPISHLSWAPDGQRLAVSVSAVQDNEGWSLVLVDTPAARYYRTGAGTTPVPATGAPDAQRSYLREGVFLPDGNLFVSRACCAGVPVRNTSRLMWEVSPAGTLIHQVAVGFADLDHTSLDASSTGRWLLYLAGPDLYVSDNGARPRELASGLIAAAWM
jgi:hypothetical protein